MVIRCQSYVLPLVWETSFHTRTERKTDSLKFWCSSPPASNSYKSF